MSYFDGIDFDSAFKALQPPEPKAPGLLRSVGDTALSLGRGAVQGTKMLSDAFGAGNAASETLQRGVDWLSSNFSDHATWEQLTSAQDQKAAALSGSTWEEIKAAARSFAKRPVDFLAEAAGTSIPTIAAAFVPGGQSAIVGRLAMMGMGAAQGAGAVKGQIHQTVQDAWLQAGATPGEARERADAAQEYFGSNAGQIAIGTALGVLAGGTGVEAGVLGARAGVGRVASEAAAAVPEGIFAKAAARVPRFAREGLKESLPEAAQGGQEQLAGNLALTNEGFETPAMQGVVGNAVLEGLAGGAFGAAASPLHARATRTSSDEGLRRLATATTTDEMVNAAMQAADVPLDGGLSAEREAAALASIEQQGREDVAGIRQSGFANERRGILSTAVPPLAPAPAQPASAETIDAPFADRVLTLREQIADPAVRDQVRAAFGDEALREVLRAASVADRPDINLPEKTRDRMLELAETIISRATLQPLPGAEPAPRATRMPAGPAIPGSRPQPALELDTRPTGAIRVDGRGSAAPETRADVIDTQQRVREDRQRRDGMTAQVTGRPLPRDFELQGEGTLTTPQRAQPKAPLAIALDTALDERAHAAATSPTNDRPEPTQAQKEAGNYAKGHIRVGGLDISVENPAGSKRAGVDEDGKAWENEVQHHYGYIRRTTGADGDHVDVFVKPGTPSDYKGPVFIVDQVNPKTGAFDEHKVIIGAADRADAEATYRANYAPDWKGLKAIKGMTMPAFRKWLGGDTTRPVGTAKDRVTTPAPAPQPAAAPASPNALPAEKLRELVELSGRQRQAVAQQYAAFVKQHGREKADQMLDRALDAAKERRSKRDAWEKETAHGLGLQLGGAGWHLPVGGLGEVVVTFTSDPGKPLRADVSAEYSGKSHDKRTAEGEPAIREAIERARAGIQEGRERMAREVVAKERGVSADKPEQIAASPAPQPQPAPDGETAAATGDAAPESQRRDWKGRVLNVGDNVSGHGRHATIGKFGQNAEGRWIAYDTDGKVIGRASSLEFEEIPELTKAAPAAPPKDESAADNGSADGDVSKKGGEDSGDAGPARVRPDELITLRKRVAVLKRLKECLNG